MQWRLSLAVVGPPGCSRGFRVAIGLGQGSGHPGLDDVPRVGDQKAFTHISDHTGELRPGDGEGKEVRVHTRAGRDVEHAEDGAGAFRSELAVWMVDDRSTAGTKGCDDRLGIDLVEVGQGEEAGEGVGPREEDDDRGLILRLQVVPALEDHESVRGLEGGLALEVLLDQLGRLLVALALQFARNAAGEEVGEARPQVRVEPEVAPGATAAEALAVETTGRTLTDGGQVADEAAKAVRRFGCRGGVRLIGVVESDGKLSAGEVRRPAGAEAFFECTVHGLLLRSGLDSASNGWGHYTAARESPQESGVDKAVAGAKSGADGDGQMRVILWLRVDGYGRGRTMHH